jgi:hypothetical protein
MENNLKWYDKVDWQWLILVLVHLGAIIGLAWYALVTGKSLEIITVIVAALIMRVGTLIDYKYGSSEGSKTKTGLMAQEQLREISQGTPLLQLPAPALDEAKMTEMFLRLLKPVAPEAEQVAEEKRIPEIKGFADKTNHPE